MNKTKNDLDARLAWARSQLADPWRVLRMLERGMSPAVVAVDTRVLTRMVLMLKREKGIAS